MGKIIRVRLSNSPNYDDIIVPIDLRTDFSNPSSVLANQKVSIQDREYDLGRVQDWDDNKDSNIDHFSAPQQDAEDATHAFDIGGNARIINIATLYTDTFNAMNNMINIVNQLNSGRQVSGTNHWLISNYVVSKFAVGSETNAVPISVKLLKSAAKWVKPGLFKVAIKMTFLVVRPEESASIPAVIDTTNLNNP